MSDFWPKDLEISDTKSPMEILESAQEDWNTRSDGVLELILEDAKSKTGNNLIIVHAKHNPNNRTITLFTVAHRLNRHYPVTIEPEDQDLPNFLKKSYYMPGIVDSLQPSAVHGGHITNKWVSDTPSEFRTKLIEIFNLGNVKASLVSLASSTSAIEADDSEKLLSQRLPIVRKCQRKILTKNRSS